MYFKMSIAIHDCIIKLIENNVWDNIPWSKRDVMQLRTTAPIIGRGFVFMQVGYLPRILYIPVPQTVHLPFMAFRPFFMVTTSVPFISVFFLHFMQYATSAIFASYWDYQSLIRYLLI